MDVHVEVSEFLRHIYDTFIADRGSLHFWISARSLDFCSCSYSSSYSCFCSDYLSPYPSADSDSSSDPDFQTSISTATVYNSAPYYPCSYSSYDSSPDFGSDSYSHSNTHFSHPPHPHPYHPPHPPTDSPSDPTNPNLPAHSSAATPANSYRTCAAPSANYPQTRRDT